MNSVNSYFVLDKLLIVQESYFNLFQLSNTVVQMAFNNKNEIHTEFVMNLHLKTQQSFFSKPLETDLIIFHCQISF